MYVLQIDLSHVEVIDNFHLPGAAKGAWEIHYKPAGAKGSKKNITLGISAASIHSPGGAVAWQRSRREWLTLFVSSVPEAVRAHLLCLTAARHSDGDSGRVCRRWRGL